MKYKINLKSFLWMLLPLGVFVMLFYNYAACNKDGNAFSGSSESPLINDKDIESARGVQDAFRKIYDLYKDRVVSISTEQTVKQQDNPLLNDPFFRDFFGAQPNMPRAEKRTGLGSGFIISEDGYICTNHHVAAGVDKIEVKIDNKTYKAKLIGSDERTDIALLKVDAKEKLKPVFMGDSDKVRVGDWAIAIGSPFGLDKTFTTGVISAIGRKDVDLMGGSQSHIQTDASINPGNSGGPLININGEVIGINRMIYSQSGGNIGIGFAIPIDKAKEVLAQLKEHKKIKRGYLGVQIVPLIEEYVKELGLGSQEGALVEALDQGGPADKGGLAVGDVILKVNETKIKDYSNLVEEDEKSAIGKTIKVEVWRNKSRVTILVTVGERPQ